MTARNIKLSLIFISIVFVALYITELVIDTGVRASDYSHYHKVNLIAEHSIDPEVAVFGSSVSEVGIDPRILKGKAGISAYNFSIDGTRFVQMKGMVEEFAEHSTQCKTVVLTEYFGTFTGTEQLTEVHRFMAHINNDNFYRALYPIQPDLIWKLRYVPFYKFIAMEHPYYKASYLGWKKKLGHGSPEDTAFGYTPKYLTWGGQLDSINKLSGPIVITIDPRIVGEYKAMVSKLVGKGIDVLIVLPPVQKDGRSLVKNLDGLRNAFQEMTSSKVHFLDLTTMPITEDKRYFYNNSHVNREGSIIFSDTLASVIKGIISK
jgi:hypothetical protein